MKEIRLVYFEGCPNVAKAKNSLVSAGIEFVEVRQNELPEDHVFNGFTSPTILNGDDIIFGEKTDLAGGCSLQVPTADEILKKLECAR